VRIFPGLAVLIVSIAAAQAQTPQPPPPLGQLIDVGGYRVHLYCIGEGSPAVMVVGGGFSFDWGLVQPEVAKFSKVCTYDVSGTAWSDTGPALTCVGRVNEIHKLLSTARIKGPYVLVGLSVGALVARLYASEYPSETAGMVIVDHAFIPTVDPPSSKSNVSSSSTRDSPPVLISKTPIVLTVEETSDFSKLPANLQQLHRWAVALKPISATVEMADDCMAQLNAASAGPYPLGNLPLVVVSTGNQARGYKELQMGLLALSRSSRQMMADRSFHSVEIDQPEVAIGAIQEVVAVVRKSTAVRDPR